MTTEWFYILFILAVSAILRYRPWRKFHEEWGEVPAVKVSWLDGSLALWVVFISVLGVQMLVYQFSQSGLYAEWFGDDLFWKASIYSLALQVPIILGAFGISWFKADYRAFLQFTFSQNIRSGILMGVYAFFRQMPWVLLVTIVYRLFLQLMADRGLIELPPQQEMVELYRNAPIGAAFFILVFCTVVGAPFAEELLFRGMMYRFVKSRLSMVNAMMLTSVVFALIHNNLSSFVPLCFLGCVLTWTFEKTGSLWSCITFHSLFNFQTLLIILFLR